MESYFNPLANYEATKRKAGYVSLKEATPETYKHIGFMSGLEVHQQLLTREKLFCHCPAGIYNKDSDYDAELVRHMRPTLSELGEYDGTALMEFKTRKRIIYRIKNESACTYEVDDSAPFPINREALENALEIALLCKSNIVGEVHISRKQYLDGSIPAGFQRTAVIGVGGHIELENKTIRLQQLCIEEDSCREISDIGHIRIFKTDRMGTPLIETVTYPDCETPEEVKTVCDYIRFMNRSTGKVRTGPGRARQDVNVSCRGGNRVEIKGVAHTRHIPQLTHNEAFRQWSLLILREKLHARIKDTAHWNAVSIRIVPGSDQLAYPPIAQALALGQPLMLIRLPGFKGALSHFTQPGKCFADELSDRLKVIACIEKPNMLHSEALNIGLSPQEWKKLGKTLSAGPDDGLVLLWGPEDDIPTALEVIEERCKMAFEGIPPETRKALPDRTTVFERVLPGANRMYPDTDSAPIPLSNKTISSLQEKLPGDILKRYHQLRQWNIPADTYVFLFSKNLYPLLHQMVTTLGCDPVKTGVLLGHRYKYLLGQYPKSRFKPQMIYQLLSFLKSEKLNTGLAWHLLPVLMEHPRLEFESALNTIQFKRLYANEITAKIPLLNQKFIEKRGHSEKTDRFNWMMGQMRKIALGNMDLTELADQIKKHIP